MINLVDIYAATLSAQLFALKAELDASNAYWPNTDRRMRGRILTDTIKAIETELQSLN